MAELIDRALELFSAGLQLLADPDPLGAVLLALAAAHAVGGPGGILPQGGAHEIAGESGEIAVRGAAVPGGEDPGDIYIQFFRSSHGSATASRPPMRLSVFLIQ